jgi:CubicO group peptidase (beta-lactamase class C family)
MRDRVEALVRRMPRRGGGTLLIGLSVHGERTLARWGPATGPADQSAVFEIGSLTKPLTGALLADMHLRDEVRLGDRLADHLPQARAWPVGEATLEQLATHRTGLPNTPPGVLVRELAVAAGIRRSDPWESIGAGEYYDLVRRARVRRLLRRRAIRYSSLAFGLLGDALAERAGRTYGQLLRERLLHPLGMYATGVSGPASLEGRSRWGRPRPAIHDRLAAAGGVRSTVPDVLSWLEACIAPAPDHPGPALALAQRPRVRVGRHVQLGFGWIIQAARHGRPPVVWHNGLTYGYRSFGAFVPEARVAVVALANTTRALERLGFALLEAGVDERR